MNCRDVTGVTAVLLLGACFSPDASVESAGTDDASGESSVGPESGGPFTSSGGSTSQSATTGTTADPTSGSSAATSTVGEVGTTGDDSSDSTGPDVQGTCSTHVLFGRDRVLWLVDVESGETTQITGTGLVKEDLPFDAEFSWSPDGESIVFRRSIGFEPDRILRLELDGQVEVVAESGPGLISPRHPVFNEAGDRIAFLVDASNSIDAYVVLADPDGSNQNIVQASPLGSILLSWSDVSFSSTLSNVVALNSSSMHYLDLPSGNSLELLDLGQGGDLADVDLTLSGQVVAYAQLGEGDDPQADADVWVLNANGTGSANLTADTAAGSYSPAWSPDGDFLAFTRRVGSDEEIFVMTADGDEVVNLTESAGNDVFHAWSPDGAAIAFVSNRSGDNRLYTVDVPSGETVERSPLEIVFPDYEMWRSQGTPQWRPCSGG